MKRGLSDVSTCARKGWYMPRGGEQQFNNTKLKSWFWAGGGVDQASCLITQSFVGPQGGRRPRQLAGGGRGSEGIPVHSEEKKKAANERDLRRGVRWLLSSFSAAAVSRPHEPRAEGKRHRRLGWHWCGKADEDSRAWRAGGSLELCCSADGDHLMMAKQRKRQRHCWEQLL